MLSFTWKPYASSSSSLFNSIGLWRYREYQPKYKYMYEDIICLMLLKFKWCHVFSCNSIVSRKRPLRPLVIVFDDISFFFQKNVRFVARKGINCTEDSKGKSEEESSAMEYINVQQPIKQEVTENGPKM